MKAVRSLGVLSAALAMFAAGPVAAQSRPVAVPVLGSPAAQDPAAPPAQPPQTPVQRPIPAQPPQVQAAPAPTAAAPGLGRGGRKLELSFDHGTMALDAQNVTVRDILMEWQRRSGCQFINADKLPPSQLPALQFPEGTPQLTVLDSLLRGLGTPTTGYGYIVGPRDASSPADAPCGAVYILPTSRPTASASYVPPPGPPVAAAPPVVPGSPDDEIPPVAVMPVPAGAQTGPQPRPSAPSMPPFVVPSLQQQMPPNGAYPGGIPTPPPQPAVQSPVFGAVPPTAPGAGAPPVQAQPPGNGRGGNQ